VRDSLLHARRSLIKGEDVVDTDFAEFIEDAKEFGISLSASQVKLVASFTRELFKWNSKINLTSSGGLRETLMSHVLDSLVPIPYLRNGIRLVDLGSGAGFPGIPIKIVRADIHVVLIESRRKRASFLNHLVSALGLDSTEVVWGRAGEEAISERFRSKPFDLAISRAAMDDRQILTVSGRLLSRTGRIVLMKGSVGSEEAESIQKQCTEFGWLPPDLHAYKLPGMAKARSLVVIDKA
jgi:16S rRNA (guanine527-N7)-methyltransferase